MSRNTYEDDRLLRMVPSLSCMEALVFTMGSPRCMEGSQALPRLRRALERTRTQAVCILIIHRRTFSVILLEALAASTRQRSRLRVSKASTPGSSSLWSQ